jgi:DNA-binding Xre family transcriptional regulator
MIVFRLEKLLAAKGWSDYKLAQVSGVDPSVVGKYKHNEVRRPDLETISAMCAALGCTAGELMEYVPDKKRKR